MPLVRDKYYIAGFWATDLEPEAPELRMVGEAWIASGFKLKRHIHPAPLWQFMLQTKGSLEWEIGGKRICLEAGQMFCLAPGVERATFAPSREPGSFLFCIFDLESVVRWMPELRAPWMSRRLSHLRNADELKPTLRKLVREATLPSPFRPTALRCILKQFVLEVSRCAAGSQKDAEALSMHRSIARAVELLDHHFQEPWSVAQLAQLVSLTPNHFSQLFRKETGESPIDYLKARRIEFARGLLRNGDLRITDIALEAGFATSQQFAREFKKITGESPHEARAKGKGRG